MDTAARAAWAISFISSRVNWRVRLVEKKAGAQVGKVFGNDLSLGSDQTEGEGRLFGF